MSKSAFVALNKKSRLLAVDLKLNSAAEAVLEGNIVVSPCNITTDVGSLGNNFCSLGFDGRVVIALFLLCCLGKSLDKCADHYHPNDGDENRNYNK